MRKRALFIALAKRHKRGNFICGRRLAIVIGPPGTFVILQGGERERLLPSSRAVCRGDTHDALSKRPPTRETLKRISTVFRETSLKSCKYAAPTFADVSVGKVNRRRVRDKYPGSPSGLSPAATISFLTVPKRAICPWENFDTDGIHTYTGGWTTMYKQILPESWTGLGTLQSIDARSRVQRVHYK